MATITHGGTLPNESDKDDFYAIIDNATLSSIANADVAAGAEIAATKLDLTGIDTNMTYASANKPRRSIILTAGGATIPSAGGAERAQTDGTNVSYWTLNFDNGGSQADEEAYWQFVVPDSFDDDDIFVTVYYIPADGSTAGDTVEFNISFRAVGANLGESIDAAVASGTAIGADVILNATPNDELHATEEATVTAPWTAGDLVIVKLIRDTSEDDMEEDAKVFAVKIEWKKDKDSD